MSAPSPSPRSARSAPGPSSSRARPAPGSREHSAAAAASASLAAAALRRQLERHGRAELVMRGRSMWPIFGDGARIQLRKSRPGEDLVGAAVAVDAGHAVIVHRVVGQRGERVLTRGLARRVIDRPWSQADVIGVVDGSPLGNVARRAAMRLAVGFHTVRQLVTRARS